MGMPLRIRHGKVGRQRGTSDDWPWLEIEKGRLRTVEYDEERGVLEGHNAEGRRHRTLNNPMSNVKHDRENKRQRTQRRSQLVSGSNPHLLDQCYRQAIGPDGLDHMLLDPEISGRWKNRCPEC
jgi:hypothetical protein